MKPLHLLALCLVCSCRLDTQPTPGSESHMEYPDWKPAQAPDGERRNSAGASVAPSSLTATDAGRSDPTKSSAEPASTDPAAPSRAQADAGVPTAPPQPRSGSPATAKVVELSAGSSAAQAGAGGATAVGSAKSAADGGSDSAAGAANPGEFLPTGSGAPPSIEVQPARPASRTPVEPEGNAGDQEQTPSPSDGDTDGNGNSNGNGNADSDRNASKKDEQDRAGEQDPKQPGSDKQEKSPDESEQKKNKKDEPKKKDSKNP